MSATEIMPFLLSEDAHNLMFYVEERLKGRVEDSYRRRGEMIWLILSDLREGINVTDDDWLLRSVAGSTASGDTFRHSSNQAVSDV